MMAKELDDGEFWLPSDFLTDDSFAETESDEDDSGVTREIAAHSIVGGEKTAKMGTSPQSTLCGMGSWSFSSGGSPDGPSQVSSPPATPFPQPRSDDALDLLCAAAGQVERLGLTDDRSYQIPPPAKNYRKSVGGFFSGQYLIQQQVQAAQQQIQAAKFYQLKKKQQSSAAWESRSQNRSRNNAVRPLDSSAWPPLQKQPPLPGSGMTAVFLNGGRRQSNGTGVFLPRCAGSPNEPRKKSACSTVLLPARVVLALNLNIEDMGVHPRFPGCYVLDNDAALGRSNLKRNHHQPATATATAAAVSSPSPELCLPQEWTY